LSFVGANPGGNLRVISMLVCVLLAFELGMAGARGFHVGISLRSSGGPGDSCAKC
jgi:hypothetical protein